MVELLAVVTMIGILAALAVAGYRNYLNRARTSDAKAIIAAIRIAQENYHAETLSYLNCSSDLGDYYPAEPNGRKRHWKNDSNADYSLWMTLNVTVDSPTSYGFAVVAGQPGENPPQPDIGNGNAIPWPDPTTEPWYVVQAAGDADNDGTFAIVAGSSFSGELVTFEETE